ncbi:MAG: APC family permease [Armatimonadetes bacterium]|nr:APC family permease [Armatimonadota bacterium]
MPQILKRAFFGKPIATKHAHHERLSVFVGLPVFASDALSSVAYASEAILGVLVLGSVALIQGQLWIAGAISLLILIVAFSYKQTIHAYPSGGGSYVVASANLGPRPGLVAGAALMIDYVLTVSVSVAAGVAALVSAAPQLHSFLVPISCGCIAIVAFANLRGVRESGALFAVPTYGFVIGISVMVVVGLIKGLGSAGPVHQTVLADPGTIGKEAMFPLVFLVLRALAAGCTALTGIEAVSNGVPAFKAPEAKNASRTLAIMAALLTVLFLGIGFLSQRLPTISLYSTHNPEYRTVVSQIAGWSFGAGSFGFFFIQAATAAILILAANTAFADFPRLASLLARDGYLPRPLARQGDRLVFQNGIVLLALASILLVYHFHGELDLLLPLYAVGVFLAFTLSQTGMVVHWWRSRETGWQRSILINGIGALATGVVMLIILGTKFLEGAWIVVVLLAVLYTAFRWIKSRYASITSQLATGIRAPARLARHTVLLLVPRLHAGIVKSLDYATSLQGNCRAIHVAISDAGVTQLKKDWADIGGPVPLVILPSPYRSLIDPVLEYVDQIHEEEAEEVVTVIVPEAVATKAAHRFLQENVAAQLKAALGSRHNVVVTNVRYFLE